MERFWCFGVESGIPIARFGGLSCGGLCIVVIYSLQARHLTFYTKNHSVSLAIKDYKLLSKFNKINSYTPIRDNCLPFVRIQESSCGYISGTNERTNRSRLPVNVSVCSPPAAAIVVRFSLAPAAHNEEGWV